MALTYKQQVQVAARTGVAVPTIGNYLSGKTRPHHLIKAAIDAAIVELGFAAPKTGETQSIVTPAKLGEGL
jgi:hypothetical protein